MSDEQNTPEEQKESSGTGLGTKVIAGAGGLAAGGVAMKAAVSHGIVSNIAEPYVELNNEWLNTNAKDIAAQIADGTKEDLVFNGEGIRNRLTHETHEIVKQGATLSDAAATQKALFDKQTVLGKARADVIEATLTPAGFLTPEAEARFNAQAQKFHAALEAGAEVVVKAPVGKKLEAAEDFAKLVTKEINKENRANIVDKVKKIPMLTRLNPFSKDLHLNGTQKGIAVVAGTAALAVGAVGINKAGQWLGGGERKK